MQAHVLFKELAAVVDAETGSAMLEYVLLKDMNQVSETKYAGLVQQVEALQPALQVIPLHDNSNVDPSVIMLAPSCCSHDSFLHQLEGHS